MMDKAKKVILLCDSSKVGRTSFISTADFDRTDCFVTEKKLPDDWVKRLEASLTEIIYA